MTKTCPGQLTFTLQREDTSSIQWLTVKQ